MNRPSPDDMKAMGVMEYVQELEEENKKLKSDLSECECSMHFENDEAGYRKRECKKLKEEIRFLEQCLDNKEKVNKSLREELEKLRIDREFEKGNTIFGM